MPADKLPAPKHWEHVILNQQSVAKNEQLLVFANGRS